MVLRPKTGLAAAIVLVAAAFTAGCPKTMFIDEGPGQATDRASGKAPAGSIGVCRVPNTKRPPLVNAELWEHARECNKRTPRRYLRLGYGVAKGPEDLRSETRMKELMAAVVKAASQADGNVAMVTTLRAVRRQALADPKLASRVERASGRTAACDYAYLLNTTQKQYRDLEGGKCSALAYDPKLRTEVCLFDLAVEEAVWLTSAWDCLAFTETLGEGESCYRLCAYDDFCAAQVSCAQPDYDLVLCGLGVCMPEKVAGIVPVASE
jgi:hypothetical protein